MSTCVYTLLRETKTWNLGVFISDNYLLVQLILFDALFTYTVRELGKSTFQLNNINGCMVPQGTALMAQVTVFLLGDPWFNVLHILLVGFSALSKNK